MKCEGDKVEFIDKDDSTSIISDDKHAWMRECSNKKWLSYNTLQYTCCSPCDIIYDNIRGCSTDENNPFVSEVVKESSDF